FHFSNSAGVNAHRVTRFAHRECYHGVALQSCKMYGLSGRLVDRFQIALRAARQIDLQTGVPKVENARAECIKPATWHLRCKATLDERGQQVVTGGDVEIRALGEFGQRRFAAGFGDRLQQVESAVNRLNVVTVTWGMGSPWASFGTRSGQNCYFHCCFSLPLREIAAPERVKEISGSRTQFSLNEKRRRACFSGISGAIRR